MRTIVILAGLGLAASMATADITYYDASANPVPIVPTNNEFPWPGGESPTYFDITKTPAEQGPDSLVALGSAYAVGGAGQNLSFYSLFSRQNATVLCNFDWYLDEEDGFYDGILLRTPLALGTPIQDHVNTIPDPGVPPEVLTQVNSQPAIFAGGGSSPDRRIEGIMGVELTLLSGTHYGWFELVWIRDSTNNVSFPAVSRWAWNDTPGGGILAGQVPAPGAMMVLGVGGLVATRRRR